jgi:hypothetical protein
LEHLLGYEPSIVSRDKLRLHQTEHPNGLPATYHLFLLTTRIPTASFIGDGLGITLGMRLPKLCPASESRRPVWLNIKYIARGGVGEMPISGCAGITL